MSTNTSQYKCDRESNYINRTSSLKLLAGFEGIPQNLLVNSVAWLILLILFSFLRKFAWNYGRIALYKNDPKTSDDLFSTSNALGYDTNTEEGEVDSPIPPGGTPDNSTEQSNQNSKIKDKGPFQWISILFRLTDKDIQEKCGDDAVQYLSFLRYMWLFMVISMVISLTVILPLNMNGSLKSPDKNQFGILTISNIEAKSNLLWGHIVSSLVLFFCALILAWRFLSRVLVVSETSNREFSLKTLMISGISRSHCEKSTLYQHFTQAFPDCKIKHIRMAYDINKLAILKERLIVTEKALLTARREQLSLGYPPMLIPNYCGWMVEGRLRDKWIKAHPQVQQLRNFIADEVDQPIKKPVSDAQTEDIKYTCCCCCQSKPINAITYYENMIKELKEKITKETELTLKSRIGIAFLTFCNAEQANYVRKQYSCSCSSPALPPSSRVSHKLRTGRWSVGFSPVPADIFWENLSLKRTVWWCKAIVINLAIFVLFFFLTTPTYVLTLVNSMGLVAFIQNNSAFFGQIFPTLVLWTISSLMPLLICSSEFFIGHWTHSSLNLTMLTKSYVFLLIMVLVLPSLGLTSLPAFFNWLFGNSSPSDPVTPPSTDNSLIPIKPPSFQWECIYAVDNGAFFVNYVITSAFIGSAMEIVRLPALLRYACCLAISRTPVDQALMREANIWAFQFGSHYAWTLCVFSVICAYSVLCPIITVFGLIWLSLKYLVVRYNLYFAYSPSRINRKTHAVAIAAMLFSVITLQINLTMFLGLRYSQIQSGMYLTSIIGLLISLICFVAIIIHSLYKIRRISAKSFRLAEMEEQQSRQQSTKIKSESRPIQLTTVTSTEDGEEDDFDRDDALAQFANYPDDCLNVASSGRSTATTTYNLNNYDNTAVETRAAADTT